MLVHCLLWAHTEAVGGWFLPCFCHVIYGWCLLMDEESAGCAQARSISAWPKFPPIFKMLCIVVFNYCFVHWDRIQSNPHRNCVIIVLCWCISSGSYIRWCVGVLTGKAQCVPAIVFFFFFPPLVLIGLPGMLFGLPCSLELNFVFPSLYCLL